MSAAGLALLCLLAAAPASRAPVPVADSLRAAGAGRSTVVPLPARGPARAQRPARPLTRDEGAALATAQRHRLAGRLPEAAEAIAPLLAAAPHHPETVTEQVRQRLAGEDLADAVRLARGERAAQRDSLLVARELAYALERLGRPLDAAAVVLEAWAASGTVTDWAQGTLLRLAASDPRRVRERTRRTARARPGRADLTLAAALLDWQDGDARGALRGLETADRPAESASLRRDFAEELLQMEARRDTASAVAALLSLAADTRFPTPLRLLVGKQAWELETARGRAADAAPMLARALRDVPADGWPVVFLAALARTLRESGHTAQVRQLLPPGATGREPPPSLELEAALADLRDGPPGRVLPRLAALAPEGPSAGWHYAEALFFTGAADSALARYRRIADEPQGPYRGAALERVYLIEDADPREALAVLGRIAYEEWRGERGAALALTDSLARALPRGPLWARTSLLLSGQRAAAGDAAGALAPLLALADSLPDDRLAPLARQRAGDLYLERLQDAPAALAQYEECLARYPRAWNAAEVRRRVERLRRGARP